MQVKEKDKIQEKFRELVGKNQLKLYEIFYIKRNLLAKQEPSRGIHTWGIYGGELCALHIDSVCGEGDFKFYSLSSFDEEELEKEIKRIMEEKQSKNKKYETIYIPGIN